MRNLKLGKLECLTCAPKEYDYGWMRTTLDHAATDSRGKVYRVAKNEDSWHLENQVMRYRSGLHTSFCGSSQCDMKILGEFIDSGLIKISEYGEVVRHYYLRFTTEKFKSWAESAPLRAAVEEIEAAGVSIETNGYTYLIHAVGKVDYIKVDGILERARIEYETY